MSKSFNGRITKWVWDGNVILHEWVEHFDEVNDEDKIPNNVQSDEISTASLQAQLDGRPSNGPPEPGVLPLPTTWLFDPDTFAPVSKIVGDKHYSIISDYRGTPLSMYDVNGARVWAAEIDIYGTVQNLHGNKSDCPFRYPGQYEDSETGLYYNRFRYYDAESCQYISVDPLRIAASMNAYSYVANPNVYGDIFGLAHSLLGEVFRGAESVFSDSFLSGGTAGRKNQAEALLTHTERKLLGKIEDIVEDGDLLKMVGELNPCKPGCQPAIRQFVLDKNIDAIYEATKTNLLYKWKKISNSEVLQEIFENGKKIGAWIYKPGTKSRRKPVPCGS